MCTLDLIETLKIIVCNLDHTKTGSYFLNIVTLFNKNKHMFKNVTFK